jgi:hypothetical protein
MRVVRCSRQHITLERLASVPRFLRCVVKFAQYTFIGAGVWGPALHLFYVLVDLTG